MKIEIFFSAITLATISLFHSGQITNHLAENQYFDKTERESLDDNHLCVKSYRIVRTQVLSKNYMALSFGGFTCDEVDETKVFWDERKMKFKAASCQAIEDPDFRTFRYLGQKSAGYGLTGYYYAEGIIDQSIFVVYKKRRKIAAFQYDNGLCKMVYYTKKAPKNFRL